jgi:Zn-dependent protease
VLQSLFAPEKLLLIVIFLGVAFPVHEFAHAFAAYRLGDSTAKHMGRLTLNPVKHFDPIGGVIFILSVIAGVGLIIGWAKPTPVNTRNLRDMRNGEVIVAIAGPLMNLVMAMLGAFVFRVLDQSGVSLPDFTWTLLYLFVLYNLGLMIFNLIPVPPLDGSTVLFRFLSPQTAWQIRPMLSQYGLLVVLLFVVFAGQQLGGFLQDAALRMVGY